MKEKLLRHIVFFKEAQLAAIELKMTRRSFKATETIIRQGDEGDSLFI